MHPAFAALEQLERVIVDDATKEAVVTWAIEREPSAMGQRLAWAAAVAYTGQPLPLLAAELEEAYQFDASAATVRVLAAALLGAAA